MPGRRKGRQIALQLLYQADWVKDLDWDKGLEYARQALSQYKNGLMPSDDHMLDDPELEEFIIDEVSGVIFRRGEIDKIISRFARGWKLDRMGAVDRNILRLGVFELCYNPDIPPKVAINEAVELAKIFGDEKSSSFVNGILDSIYRKWCSEKISLERQEV